MKYKHEEGLREQEENLRRRMLHMTALEQTNDSLREQLSGVNMEKTKLSAKTLNAKQELDMQMHENAKLVSEIETLKGTINSINAKN